MLSDLTARVSIIPVGTKGGDIGVRTTKGDAVNGDSQWRRYRLAQFRVVLVREGTVPTAWDRQVRASRDVATLMRPLVAGLDREQFWVLLLNAKNRAIGLNLVSVGALNTTIVHPREVMKPAILSNAAAVVLVHNHPSGDPAPSAEDVALTQRLWAAGELLGIRVLDHVVVGDDGGYCSLADQGALGGAK